MTTLTLLDVSGIQRYLFGSNRLTHNLGASYLVERATDVSPGGWIAQALNKTSGEWLFAGGGNATLRFNNRDAAKAFAHHYSRMLLEQAPGLRVVVHHTDQGNEPLAKAYFRGLKELANVKSQQTTSNLPLSLGVTATCRYTDQPAVNEEKDRRRIGPEVQAKLNALEQARKRLSSVFDNVLNRYQFIDDFNLYGERDESSYIAVIHADGNGMGKRKDSICRKHVKDPNSTPFIEEMRAFSNDVKRAGETALKDTVDHLTQWVEADTERYETFVKNGFLPFTPLVFGGDDVTFVTDGRLGLSLAVKYLRAFHAQQVQGENVFACAGVAIVKNRYPFARAYELSEGLCNQAKHAVRKLETDALALDWHIGINGAVRGVHEVREADYSVYKLCDLTARPYYVDAPETSHKSLKEWGNFRNVVIDFQSGKFWRDKRNKVKRLREVLRQGPEATQAFCQAYGIGDKHLPEIPGLHTNYQKDGWDGQTCAYFDAIEVMDLFEDMEAV